MTDIQEGDNAVKAAAEDLKSYAERLARVEDEIAVLREDKKEIFAEAKARGYDVKALRTVIALSKKEPDELAVIQLYGERMGVFA